ncbi:CI116 protein, partial [Hylia prasina]|nr:CI116 protein [Hylia prasina]
MSGPSPAVPRRFQELTFCRGYGTLPSPSPTPFSRHPQTSFHSMPHKFSDHLGKAGMYRNNGLNTSLETSHCTGSDTFITAYEHLDFHPSYNPSGPSHCRDQPP